VTPAPADRNHATLCAMAETVFAKILRGEIPCHRIYEDDAVLAFLDVHPLSRGHTLVIPKEPAETVDQLSDDAAAAIGRVLPRIARAVLAATGARAYNILQNNGPEAHQAVFHVHFHIIPKLDDGSGLGIGWKASQLADGGELARAIAAKL
jgi:histidine triad (HIT) family protein